MRAWTLVRHGEPSVALELREFPNPRPVKGEVLIRAEGFGLNYAELMATRGLYRDAPKPPCILGYETVGRVEQCGEGVPDELRGRRVVAIKRFGGHAELVVADHRACMTIPDDMPLGVAAALATQGCTAWYSARILCPLRTGDRVLVHNAAGGVGQLLVQLAVHSGCDVTALVGSADKIDVVKRMGAARVLARSSGDHYAQIRAAIGDAGVDVSFNAMGGSSFRKDLSLLGSGGRLVIFGGATRAPGWIGIIRFLWGMGLIVPALLMTKSRSVLGVNMLRIGEQKPELLAECLREAVEAQAQGILRPMVHATYPCEELPKAYAMLASGHTIGKVAVIW